ncbi:MAG: hypothetical protein E6R08_06495 [Nevskiaceae bacterium]|nr:MAG: hypothetical protein E6R08_06495 [Nevskiaceae bacterium]
MILTDTLYKGVAAVTTGGMIALAVACGYLYVDRAHTEVQLAEKSGAYDTLSASVNIQNQAVKNQADATKEAFKRVDAALALAKVKDAKLQPVIDFVTSAKGTSCSDAMPLIDAALKGKVK